MIDCTGSQAHMSPLSTIATITLLWSIVAHTCFKKVPSSTLFLSIYSWLISSHLFLLLSSIIPHSFLSYSLAHPLYLPHHLYRSPTVGLSPTSSFAVSSILLLQFPQFSFITHFLPSMPLLLISLCQHSFLSLPPSFPAIPLFCPPLRYLSFPSSSAFSLFACFQ